MQKICSISYSVIILGTLRYSIWYNRYFGIYHSDTGTIPDIISGIIIRYISVRFRVQEYGSIHISDIYSVVFHKRNIVKSRIILYILYIKAYI